MKKTITILSILVLVIIGLFIARSVWAPTSPTKNDVKNTTYIIEGSLVRLVNGVSETPAAPDSASKITTTYFGNEATGDLNGDGKPDTAFLLTQSSGGSGTFYYVTVALQTNDGYRGTNAILLGDRIAPQTTEIKNGVITVNYADRKSGEPMSTSPSLGISKYFHVVSGNLEEIQK